jgi:hypothetical protein
LLNRFADKDELKAAILANNPHMDANQRSLVEQNIDNLKSLFLLLIQMSQSLAAWSKLLMFKTTHLLANGDSIKEDFLTTINQMKVRNLL